MAKLILTAIGLLLLMLGSARAETVVANGTIRGGTLIGPEDVTLIAETVAGAHTSAAQVVGMEAQINLYPGRPIRPGDLRPPAVVERNAIVTIRYDHGGLLVTTEGRAMDRAARGEALRVLNLSSRTTITAVAEAPGLVVAGPHP